MSTSALKVEVDGPDAAPETVDARLMLELASAYIDLVTGIANELDVPLVLRGLRIEDKCVAVTVPHVEPADLFQRLANVALEVLKDPNDDSYPTLRRRLATALGKLPEGYSSKVLYGDWAAELEVPQRLDRLPASRITLRVIPKRVGGARPRVWLTAASEEMPFTLDVDVAVARELGQQLYKPIDAELVVNRAVDGRIAGGKLVSFATLDDVDVDLALRVWRDWFTQVASDLNNTEDLRGALGRR